ncbi:uncharacterized protein A4U43_C07F28630 [Asparagus officinalis]|uniref:Uncharacterized protein n=1 Tax=Asparagus officinalis TaxID=4686 RepID=A0A5P1EFY6_ASPOF|nr:uncharacterized protein A4U43_C07F28630 [Asparagus officinalis]
MASQQPKPLWNFDPVGGQILDPIAFYTLNQPQPPFFHVMGPNVAVDGLSSWEPQMKRPKEEVLSLDSFKIGQVSTGLGLSLDNPNLNLASSSGDSGSAYNRLSSAGGVFDRELQRMDAEIDSFIRLQGLLSSNSSHSIDPQLADRRADFVDASRDSAVYSAAADFAAYSVV